MKIRKIKIKNLGNQTPCYSALSGGIICGSESFAVQFGDHLPSGDHLRSEIIYGAVHVCLKT